jgi:hypothetical protein
MKKQIKAAKSSSAVLRRDKPAKSSTASSKTTKNNYPVEYLDIFTLRMKPTHPTVIEQFFLFMPKWAQEDPEAFKISQYRILKGVSQKTMEHWKTLDPKYDEAYETTKAILGNKREIGWIKKQYEPSAIRLSMRNYDPEWIALTTEDESKGNVTVVMQVAPTTKEVPDKK